MITNLPEITLVSEIFQCGVLGIKKQIEPTHGKKLIISFSRHVCITLPCLPCLSVACLARTHFCNQICLTQKINAYLPLSQESFRNYFHDRSSGIDYFNYPLELYCDGN